MPIDLKTHIQTQSKIMKKRQRKKNNKNVFIPLIPFEMTEEEVKQILKTRKVNKLDDRRNMHHSTCDGAIYGFYIHDYLQAMMCVADIGFFVCV